MVSVLSKLPGAIGIPVCFAICRTKRAAADTRRASEYPVIAAPNVGSILSFPAPGVIFNGSGINSAAANDFPRARQRKSVRVTLILHLRREPREYGAIRRESRKVRLVTRFV
jgi:hypothetical protein